MKMADLSIYEEISRRTEGDIYIGVVGPVRTGKSTLINRFMQTLVLPYTKFSGLIISCFVIFLDY